MEKKKAMKKSENPMLDKVLYEWFRQRRAENVPISGQTLIKKPKDFHKKLNIEKNCNYSLGWLYKFKNRHGIRSLLASGKFF